MVPAKTTSDPQSQSQRFKQAAREVGCDDSEERFNDALKAVAKHKPRGGAKPPPSENASKG